MKKDYTTRFVSSAKEVLAEIVNTRVAADVTLLEKDTIHSLGVVILIVLTGQLRGRILIDMSKETAVGIAELMTGEVIKRFNDTVQDAVIEIGNLIAGRFITVMRNTMVTDIEMNLPILFAGEEMRILDTHTETMAVSLETQFGNVDINVAVMENR